MNNDIFNLSIDIKFCHISYHDADWVERKTKMDYTIWNIISGSLFLEMNDQTLSVQEGDVLLFHPGDSYKAWCRGDCCSFLVTFFTIDMGNTINLLTAAPTAGLYRNEYVREISTQFCTEYQTRFSKLQNPNLSLYASFLTFFAALSTQFGTQQIFNNKKDSDSELWFTSLAEYVESHIEEKITVADMAAFMGMSEKYFSSYFHIHIGMTPKQYLTKCRMKYALELLANPNYTLQKVASILQFSDQYSFAKAFKNYYGEAPGTFRKHYIKS